MSKHEKPQQQQQQQQQNEKPKTRTELAVEAARARREKMVAACTAAGAVPKVKKARGTKPDADAVAELVALGEVYSLAEVQNGHEILSDAEIATYLGVKVESLGIAEPKVLRRTIREATAQLRKSYKLTLALKMENMESPKNGESPFYLILRAAKGTSEAAAPQQSAVPAA